MWIDGNRGATRRYADTAGIFPDGVWILQAVSDERQPKKPVKPAFHLPRALYTRKHGFEAKAHKN